MKKIRRFLRRMYVYLKKDVVMTILFLIFLSAGIGYFVSGMNTTFLLLVAAANVLFVTFEKNRFFDRMKIKALKFIDLKLIDFLAEENMMPFPRPEYEEQPLFAIIIKTILIIGIVFVMILFCFFLITGRVLIFG